MFFLSSDLTSSEPNSSGKIHEECVDLTSRKLSLINKSVVTNISIKSTNTTKQSNKHSQYIQFTKQTARKKCTDCS